MLGPIKVTLADRYKNSYPTDVHSPYTAPVSTPAQNTSGPGPWNNFNSVSASPQLQQINPAGTSSPDGMMTMPTLPLYPGEAIGIDGVPYRPSAGQNNNPSSYSYEPNRGGSAAANATPVANVLGTRQFNQRTPSGSVYAPDMSAYNDSSLFNYTGPGGVPEYTYGQGLRTDGADYSIFGSPADAANPYFEGQFAKSTGPADAAINMNPVVMPAGIPAIGGGSGTTTASNSAGDLTYQQTIDSMGIFGPNNPPPSTTFPSPGGATTPANMGLTERQIAQMSPQQQAYMTQTLANQDRMQQGQINRNKEVTNIAGSPDISMMDNQAAANMAMGNRAGYPNQITDRTAEILAAAKANGGIIDGTEVVDGNEGLNLFRESFLRNRSLDKDPQTIYGGLDGTPIDSSMLLSEGPQTRQSNKPDKPFVPAGTEGVDYWQSTNGDFFSMEDDMGTQAIKPGNMADDTSPFTTDYSEPMNVFAGMPPERGFFKTDEAGIDKPANLSSYEADGDIESTSNNMGALDDSYAAIDAKYEGSTTNESQLAKLKEVISATNNAYGGNGSTNARGSRGDTVPADIPAFLDQNISRMADKYVPSPAETDYPPAYPSYAIENEGTSTGESLFQGVSKVPSDSQYQYSGAYKNAAGSNAAIDAVVKQQEAQQAQVQKTKAKAAARARAADAAEARRNPPAKPKPKKVKVSYNRNKPTPVKKSKPTPRGPKPSKPTRSTGSRGGRGNVAKKKSTPSKSYSSYSRRVGGR